jgi:hypothetical protein
VFPGRHARFTHHARLMPDIVPELIASVLRPHELSSTRRAQNSVLAREGVSWPRE